MVAALGLLAAVVAGSAVWVARATPQADGAPSTSLATVPVTVGTMVAETAVRGTLRFPGGVPVTAGPAGVVTMLPPVGTTINPGDVLYTVNTRPVVLLSGALPAWRDFAVGMSDGDDVRQLEQALVTFGYFRDTPDARFTDRTAAAVKRWQKALGVDQAGTVARSEVLFADSPVRVAALTSRLGADVAGGSELYNTSGTDKVVDIDLTLGDQELAVVGAAVTVVLPDGTDLPATVTGVGAAVERAGADGSTPEAVVPVTVSLADQAGAAAFSQADVSVRFASTLADGVLTVPVEALVPLDGSTFGVEVPGERAGDPTTVLPVTAGSFASGRVQISGEGIRAGLDVVVPTR
ncbi:peptidoglycan-binding domain-containing protein [Pengzhenrongella sicca]|uniref:Peptidoglycan-binding protein n=1 Tax=Pengzhenrongella sicca TaxID=2819238 RepID=A0A8A4ZJE4_9MICO|nr:peptidoglycan-binding domain-containing protein [Pengzhenrongella sicca]QTE31089.1 peptidoglycan-binding protein [Pengzhenrongella sicca]